MLHGKSKEGELRKEGDSTVDIKNEIAGKEHKKREKKLFLFEPKKLLFEHSL